MKKNEVIVVVSYSFDEEKLAIIFDDYKKASNFIKKDFENEKRIAKEENDWEINENSTFCEEDIAKLTTIFNGTSGTITWTIANVFDERK